MYTTYKNTLEIMFKGKGIVNKDKGITYASSVWVHWLNRPLLTRNAHLSPNGESMPTFSPV